MSLTGERLERMLGIYSKLVERWLRTAKQMTPEQYARIVATIDSRAPCGLLIFGCGSDSLLWHELNVGGTTLFVESDKAWSQRARTAGLRVIDVQYESKLNEWMDPVRLPSGIPGNLADAAWDLILVDAPLGIGADAPGREQSVYAASQWRRNASTQIFMHDYERTWDKACCDRYLGTPSDTLGNLAIWQPLHRKAP
jgi:hypothetical protein